MKQAPELATKRCARTAPLTVSQREALEQFPIGEWVGIEGPQWGIHISVLSSLVARGLILHRPDPDLPNVILGAGRPWTQHLKLGRFQRVGADDLESRPK